MEIIKPEKNNRADEFQKHGKIHISDLAYHECDRYLYLLYSGGFTPEYDQQTLWHFAVGKKFHELIEESYKEAVIQEGNYMTHFVFSEVPVEYGDLSGRLDLLEMDLENNIIDIIDIKTTNSYIVDKEPTEAMKAQVMTYAGIVAETGGFKDRERGWIVLPENARIRCWIWKVNKGGIPRYFDWEQDRWPVNGDIYAVLEKQAERATGLVKSLKAGKSPQKRPILCAGCPAKAVCGNIGVKLEL